MEIKINFDGAVRESKLGTDMGIGVAVFVDGEYQEGISLAIGVKGSATSSSNVAEWMACVEAMKLAAELYEIGDIIEIYSDSQIIAYQFNGQYAIKKPEFWSCYEDAKSFAINVGIEKINWIRREFNKEADKLSKKGLQLISPFEKDKSTV